MSDKKKLEEERKEIITKMLKIQKSSWNLREKMASQKKTFTTIQQV